MRYVKSEARDRRTLVEVEISPIRNARRLHIIQLSPRLRVPAPSHQLSPHIHLRPIIVDEPHLCTECRFRVAITEGKEETRCDCVEVEFR